MSALKNHHTAAAITVVVVVLSLLFGTVRSVHAEARNVERMFTEGVDGSGYGIAGDLDERAEYATRLTKIAAKYSGMDREIALVQGAVTVISTAETADMKYLADQDLEGAVTELDLALQNTDLSETDEKYRSETMAGFQSPGFKIDKEAVRYNAEVQKYQDEVLGGLVARLVDNLIPLPEVEAFE